MDTAIPQWADKDLSLALPKICEGGEGSRCDFKVTFPDQSHRLGKLIAAFATSGGGDIFIGVDDSGTIVGIDGDTADKRDDMIERGQNIARTVAPPPIVKFQYAIHEVKVVLVVRVGKQQAPVYYHEQRPYVREGSQARPARPEEVVDLVCASAAHRRRRVIKKRRHFLRRPDDRIPPEHSIVIRYIVVHARRQ